MLAATGIEFAASIVLTTPALALVEQPEPVPSGTVWRPLAGQPLRVSGSVVRRSGDDREIVGVVAELLRTVLVETGGWTAERGLPPATPTRGAPVPRPADSLLA